METLTDKLITHIDQLLSNAKTNEISYNDYNNETFIQWRTSAEALIIKIAGKDSPYYRNFFRKEYISTNKSYMDYGNGALKALKEDLELGFLDQIKDIILAEIFTDFLDMTQHLLEAGYKDPAASLIGAVLEDGLRKISDKNSLPVKSNDDIGSLNTKLADAKVYNRFTQRQIQAWKAIRDSAVHGKFDEYTLEDVKAMMEGVGRFLPKIYELISA